MLGDHRVSCPRCGLLACRALAVEQAWIRVAREAVGPEGRVVPQQGLSRTTAPGVSPDNRRRLDLVVYGAAERGSTEQRKRTRYPELGQPGPRGRPRG